MHIYNTKFNFYFFAHVLSKMVSSNFVYISLMPFANKSQSLPALLIFTLNPFNAVNTRHPFEFLCPIGTGNIPCLSIRACILPVSFRIPKGILCGNVPMTGVPDRFLLGTHLPHSSTVTAALSKECC